MAVMALVSGGSNQLVTKSANLFVSRKLYRQYLCILDKK